MRRQGILRRVVEGRFTQIFRHISKPTLGEIEKKTLLKSVPRTYLEISEQSLQSNLNFFRQRLGGETKLACVIKGNAYGHGDVLMGELCEQHGAEMICVNSLYEAYRIRDSGVRLPILILGYIPSSRLRDALRLENSAFGLHSFEQLNCLKSLGQETHVHLKLDTGLKRVGFVEEDLEELTRALKACQNWLRIEGIFTHLARAESAEDPIYRQQKESWDRSLEFLRQKQLTTPLKHFQKSGSSLLVEEHRTNNLTRFGITLYGLWPCSTTKKNYLQACQSSGNDRDSIEPLRAVLSVHSKVQGIYRRREDRAWIALLPFGYNDQLAFLQEVHIGGRNYAVCAQHSNFLEILLGPETQVRSGDGVLILGPEEKANSADQIAAWSETINYEVITRMNKPMFRRRFGEEEFQTELLEKQATKYRFFTEFNASLQYSRQRLKALFRTIQESVLRGAQTPGKTRYALRINNQAVIFRDQAVTREVLKISDEHLALDFLVCQEVSEATELNRLFPQKRIILDTVADLEEDEIKLINEKAFTLVLHTPEQAKRVLALKKINLQVYLKVYSAGLTDYLLEQLDDKERDSLVLRLRGVVCQHRSDLALLESMENLLRLSHETDVLLLEDSKSVILGEFQILANSRYSRQFVESLDLSQFQSKANKKFVRKGEKIGYDWTYEMKRDGYIAVVPVGYYDGFSRRHSNNGVAIIDGQRCPLVGKVYMNFSSYDITDHPNLSQINSEHQVILSGVSTEGASISQSEFSLTPMEKNFSSINYRLPRILVD